MAFQSHFSAYKKSPTIENYPFCPWHTRWNPIDFFLFWGLLGWTSSFSCEPFFFCALTNLKRKTWRTCAGQILPVFIICADSGEVAVKEGDNLTASVFVVGTEFAVTGTAGNLVFHSPVDRLCVIFSRFHIGESACSISPPAPGIFMLIQQPDIFLHIFAESQQSGLWLTCQWGRA